MSVTTVIGFVKEEILTRTYMGYLTHDTSLEIKKDYGKMEVSLYLSGVPTTMVIKDSLTEQTEEDWNGKGQEYLYYVVRDLINYTGIGSVEKGHWLAVNGKVYAVTL